MPPSSEKTPRGSWKDEWQAHHAVAETPPVTVALDELRIKRLRKAAKRVNAAWEIDFFCSATPISEGEIPCYPYAIMIADHDAGLILDIHLTERSGCEKEFTDRLLGIVENLRQMPRELLVRKKEASVLFNQCASSLQIAVNISEDLSAVDSAREGMLEHLRSLED